MTELKVSTDRSMKEVRKMYGGAEMVEYNFRGELIKAGFDMKLPIAQLVSLDGYLVFTQEDRWSRLDERENEIALDREEREYERVMNNYPYELAFY